MKLTRSLHKVNAFKAIPSLSIPAIPCFGSKEEVLFGMLWESSYQGLYETMNADSN